MSFAIMRCKKLKGMGSVASSLQHCYRERETKNADADKTPSNQYSIADNADEAMGNLRNQLPEKYRKDAVLAVEYMMTTSPDWWENASEKDQAQFFARSKDWLMEKYGDKNVIAFAIHKDEKTPHVSAYVVPRTIDGRLSAKEFIGNRDKMSQDQSSFAEKMKDLGLERGIEGSTARHVTIQQYYARVNSGTPVSPSVSVLEPTVVDRIKTFEYGEKVATSVLNQLKPAWESLWAKAAETDAAQNRAKKAEITAKEIQILLQQERQRADKLTVTADNLYAISKCFTPEEIKFAVDRKQTHDADRAKEDAEAARAAAIGTEMQRRVEFLLKPDRALSGAASTYATTAKRAINDAGSADQVDWAVLDGKVAAAAIGKHGQSPESTAKTILEMSPLRADPANHSRVSDWMREHSSRLQAEYAQARAVRDKENGRSI